LGDDTHVGGFRGDELDSCVADLRVGRVAAEVEGVSFQLHFTELRDHLGGAEESVLDKRKFVDDRLAVDAKAAGPCVKPHRQDAAVHLRQALRQQQTPAGNVFDFAVGVVGRGRHQIDVVAQQRQHPFQLKRIVRAVAVHRGDGLMISRSDAGEDSGRHTRVHVMPNELAVRLRPEDRLHRRPGLIGTAIVNKDELRSPGVAEFKLQSLERLRQVRQRRLFVVTGDDDGAGGGSGEWAVVC